MHDGPGVAAAVTATSAAASRFSSPAAEATPPTTVIEAEATSPAAIVEAAADELGPRMGEPASVERTSFSGHVGGRAELVDVVKGIEDTDFEEERKPPFPKPPAHPVVPQESPDGSDGIDGNSGSPSTSTYPESRRRKHPGPSKSEETTPSHTNTEEGSSTPQQLPRQLPPQGTSVSCERLSVSGSMPPQSDSERDVPSVTSQGGQIEEDRVIFSCFAPPAVRPGIRFGLEVRACLDMARDPVLRAEMAPGAAETGRPESVSIAKGKRVTVELVRTRADSDCFDAPSKRGSMHCFDKRSHR